LAVGCSSQKWIKPGVLNDPRVSDAPICHLQGNGHATEAQTKTPAMIITAATTAAATTTSYYYYISLFITKCYILIYIVLLSISIYVH
jgi:hypothetical protein